MPCHDRNREFLSLYTRTCLKVRFLILDSRNACRCCDPNRTHNYPVTINAHLFGPIKNSFRPSSCGASWSLLSYGGQHGDASKIGL